MNREIIFKAKVKDWEQKPKDKQWVYGYYVRGFDIYEKPIHIIFDTTTIFYSSGETDGWDEIDANTLCRYTGLTDKNGKKIWENDIVKDSRGNLYKVFWQENYYQFAFICIKANDALLFGAKWDLWSLAKNKDLELQGSIFDNPELLKVGAEG